MHNRDRIDIHLTVDIHALVVVAHLEVAVRIAKLVGLEGLGATAIDGHAQDIVAVGPLVRESGSFFDSSHDGEVLVPTACRRLEPDGQRARRIVVQLGNGLGVVGGEDLSDDRAIVAVVRLGHCKLDGHGVGSLGAPAVRVLLSELGAAVLASARHGAVGRAGGRIHHDVAASSVIIEPSSILVPIASCEIVSIDGLWVRVAGTIRKLQVEVADLGHVVARSTSSRGRGLRRSRGCALVAMAICHRRQLKQRQNLKGKTRVEMHDYGGSLSGRAESGDMLVIT